MRRFIVLASAIVLLLAIPWSTAVADWIPENGHKMHYPQLPDELGWDVNATSPAVLADDWMCGGTGPVTDIHFWGSWRHADKGQIVSFIVRIYSDIPIDPPTIPYSRPGVLLWEQEIGFSGVVEQQIDAGLEGWFDLFAEQIFPDDHNQYFQYNIFLPEQLWFHQEEGSIYWLSISAIIADPVNTHWGWKSSINHWNDDAVLSMEDSFDWIELREPPLFEISLDLAFVITGPEESEGACCWDPTGGPGREACIVTTPTLCASQYGGSYQGDGTTCGVVQACCLQDGTCIDADPLCCVNEYGGSPQGPGTNCVGVTEACCFTDGSCSDLDPICCLALGGAPQGQGTACQGDINLNGIDDACEDPEPEGACCYPPAGAVGNSLCVVTTPTLCASQYNGSYQGDGTTCGVVQACCLQDGTCIDADPLCCVNEFGGSPQGPGTNCSGVTEACCFTDGSCSDLDPICCLALGGAPQGQGTACQGDINQNGVDDACEEPTQDEACCLPDGTCTDIDRMSCINMGGVPQGPGTVCSGTTIACCLPDGTCADLDPLCCDEMGGIASPTGVAACMGDLNQNGTDDACEGPGWDPGDPHKMHFPQLPDEVGWDVNATVPIILADDWMCSETGWVQDIHFWGSWMHGEEGIIDSFTISFHSDVPAGPTNPYSHPGLTLDDFTIREFVIVPIDPPASEGWYDPLTGETLFDDHGNYFQYNIYLPEEHWLMQEAGTIYWLNISAHVREPQATRWGWKSSAMHWNDDAVWAEWFDLTWEEMYEPSKALSNNFWLTIDPQGNYVIGGGSEPFDTGWFFYPETEWWNIWFYDHPFDPARFKPIRLEINTTLLEPTSAGYITIALNYSTDLWSLEGNPQGEDRIPPLPGVNEGMYIARRILYEGDVYPELFIFEDTIWDYNPEWVSVDIQGYNFAIDGVIWHDCITSLDLSFVITGEPDVEPTGACCYPPPGAQGNFECVVTTAALCASQYNGSYQGDDTPCGTVQACCLSDGTCIDADSLCCINELGGTPQGTGTNCSGVTEACCFPDGSCADLDPLCCFDQGGTPQGSGTICLGDINLNSIDDACEEPEPEGACCYSPTGGPIHSACVVTTAALCASQYGGDYEGDGTSCGTVQACCLSDGTCFNADSFCCINELGGTPQGTGTVCLGDANQNSIDDACEEPTNEGACCFEDGTCDVITQADCEADPGAEYKGDGTSCLGDANQNGIDDACEIPIGLKWEQPPNLEPTGMDILSSYLADGIVIVLADDFNCVNTGKITEIHVWASWYGDMIPSQGPGSFPITLSFHSDVPAGVDLPWSHPGELLRLYTFLPGQYEVVEYMTDIVEGWYWPYDESPEAYVPEADHVCWEYIFTLPEGEEFIQEGSSTDPLVYWLDVMADLREIQEEVYFGWKTTPIDFNWNDDAVWAFGPEPVALESWREMIYPEQHPWYSESINLAFALYGEMEEDTCDEQYPGDVNNDGAIGADDVTYLAAFLYSGGPAPPVMANADPNGDCFIDEADIKYLTEYLFGGGPDPVDCTCVDPEVCNCFVSDANSDGTLNVGDAVYLINYVFKGGNPPAPYRNCNGDANSDCTINVGDAVFLINYVFKGGARPPYCHQWIQPPPDGCNDLPTRE